MSGIIRLTASNLGECTIDFKMYSVQGEFIDKVAAQYRPCSFSSLILSLSIQ